MKNILQYLLILVLLSLLQSSLFAQNVGVGILSPEGKLHVKGTDDTTQLIIDADTMQSISHPLFKLRNSDGADLLWLTTDDSTNVFLGLKAGASNVLDFQGINNTFLGSKAGFANTNGRDNIALGTNALKSNTKASYNVALGTNALYSQSFSPPNGAWWQSYNVAIGYEALYANQPTNASNGVHNTATGSSALRSNTTGSNNIAIGSYGLYLNTSGANNIACGISALNSNTTAGQNVAVGNRALLTQSYNPGFAWSSGNVAIGYEALYANQPTSTADGINNTAVGHSAMRANTTGLDNTAIGVSALYSNTSGNENTASGRQAMFYNTTGIGNTASGYKALRDNTSGFSNAAFGHSALTANTTGYENTGIGVTALYSNTSGALNTATGRQAMFYNSSGNYNTANGYKALRGNISGSSNTAIGAFTLHDNTGQYNTAIGYEALYYNNAGSFGVAIGTFSQFYANSTGTAWDNTNTSVGYQSLRGSNTTLNNTGLGNTAVGRDAMHDTSTGYANTGLGYQALTSNSSGYDNTATGYEALQANTSGYRNTAVGLQSMYFNTIGTYNTAIGFGAYYNGTAWSNSVSLGANTYEIFGDNVVRVGNASMISIGGKVGWTTMSDSRVKKNVNENVPGLSFINKLRPVTYHYDMEKEYELLHNPDTCHWNGQYDVEKISFSGFLAQEVETAAKEINFEFSGVDVPQNKDGIYGLRYAEFVVPLVKAVQELSAINSRLVEKQDQQVGLIYQLKTQNENLTARMNKLEALMNGSKQDQ